MELFVVRYPELVKDAITAATNKITQQTLVLETADKKVKELRAIDNTSTYTSIGSNAGQAEIAYNIEAARLRYDIEQLELIRQWADQYLEYIKNHDDGCDFNNIKTFRDLYTFVNQNHLERLIQGHRFECKCQFFGHTTENNQSSNSHFYVDGAMCCSWGVPVHLSNTQTAIQKVGFIGCTVPEYVYPLPNSCAE
jgi:hypothetical protein